MIGSISRRYARALLEVAGPQGSAEAVADELERLAQAVKASEELRNVLFNPAFDRAQRQSVVDALIGAMSLGPIVGNLARLLVDRDRFSHAGAIALSYRELADEQAGRARASSR